MTDSQVVIFGDSLSAFDTALSFARVGVPVSIHLGSTQAWPTGGIFDADGFLRDLISEISTPLNCTPVPKECVIESNVSHETFSEGADLAGELSYTHLFGIPANVFDRGLAKSLSIGARVRIYLDKLMPVFGYGKYTSLYELTKKRMGSAVADGILAPILQAKYGVAPELVEIDAVLPELNGAITRRGSLSGAVLEICAKNKQKRTVAPTIGWTQFREAFLDRLIAYNVQINPDTQPAKDAICVYDGFTNLPDDVEFPAVSTANGAPLPPATVAACKAIDELHISDPDTIKEKKIWFIGDIWYAGNTADAIKKQRKTAQNIRRKIVGIA